MLRALVFDFDGLIFDTESACFTAWQQLFADHGSTLSLSEWIDAIGRAPGDHDPTRLLAAKLGRQLDSKRLRREQQRRERRLLLRQPACPGARELIRDAQSAGLRLAVASSSEIAWVRRYLRQLGLRRSFETLACASATLRAKPNPDVYLAALAALRVPARAAVALEDSVHGVCAANAAGILCVAVPNPLLREFDFSDAALRVGSLTELSIPRLASLVAPGKDASPPGGDAGGPPSAG